jgi:hypothetical protein
MKWSSVPRFIFDSFNKKREKGNLVPRQCRYSEITLFVTETLAEITKGLEEAKKQKTIFLENGNRIASTSILQCAAEAGYSKQDVFENGIILVQRRFFKKGK